MGVFGKMFPSRELEHDDGQDGGGQTHRPRLELDLDAGVMRLAPATPAVASGQPDPTAGSDQAGDTVNG